MASIPPFLYPLPHGMRQIFIPPLMTYWIPLLAAANQMLDFLERRLIQWRWVCKKRQNNFILCTVFFAMFMKGVW
jgi:hypothetical protein